MPKKVAIIGGGISGVAAAYELAKLNQNFTLYEASPRLGGIVETVRGDGFTIECGPDAWVTEKPWAHELAIELGLEDEIISSNDSQRRTYLLNGRGLTAIPDRMRMMVPGSWAPLLNSDLFSWQARLAYLREPKRAEELRKASPSQDESVSSFVRRHFGDEVADKVAAPLLSGVFGGSIDKLSVRAVMAPFVKMEQEHGSLITALHQKQSSNAQQLPVFTTLKTGLGTLVERAVAKMPGDSLRMNTPVTRISRDQTRWRIQTSSGWEDFDEIIVCTPAHITRELLTPIESRFDSLLTMESSSAITIAFAFAAAESARMRIPRGFGYLVPRHTATADASPSLLACTFANQKFRDRAPVGCILLRAFFGGQGALKLSSEANNVVASLARQQLALALGPLPDPCQIIIRRWPLSLPQYNVGHLEKLAAIESLTASIAGLHLVGNAYRGVGLPDLIRDGRATAREVAGR